MEKEFNEFREFIDIASHLLLTGNTQISILESVVISP